MRRELFVLTVFWLFGHLAADECKHHLNSLAVSQQDFVRCSTLHAVPVELCVSCKGVYDIMTLAYANLSKTVNCSEKYFDKDRINIVATTQSILTGLWAKAYCDDCYTGDNMDTFSSKSSILKTCYQDNEKHECAACITPYQELNNFYNTLTQNNHGQVCYDIQDNMNRTRSQWSKDFNCCKRQFNMLLFICASSFATLLPVLFYCGTFLYGKRRERNHGVIDADPEVTAPLVSEETAPLQRNSIVAPPASNLRITKNSSDYESDSSDSDYNATNKKLG